MADIMAKIAQVCILGIYVLNNLSRMVYNILTKACGINLNLIIKGSAK